MRLATLIGRTEANVLECLGIGEGNDITKLVELRDKIVAAGGLIKSGKEEVHLSELRLLSNATSGGELKGAMRFRTPSDVQADKDRAATIQKAREAKAKADAKAEADAKAKAKAAK
jgi:hypothetical protein